MQAAQRICEALRTAGIEVWFDQSELRGGDAWDHLALGNILREAFDFGQASQEYERAVALAPGDSHVLRNAGSFAAYMGHFDEAIATVRRAVILDPLAGYNRLALGYALYAARRYGEAAAAFAEALSLSPNLHLDSAYGARGLALLGLGDIAGARAACESKPDYWLTQQCLALVYRKLGRPADAQAELAKLNVGDSDAYAGAEIYAQWGDTAKALASLDTAVRLRDPGLELLKTDPLMDPLRAEPRFQAILRKLNFPSRG